MSQFHCIFILLIAITYSSNAQNALPKVVSGKIERIENFTSKYVPQRNIDIWLPDGYSDTNKYATLYMQDGQMLFDPEQTWNKQSWNIDDVISVLIKRSEIKSCIIIAIWNSGETRRPEYFPQKPFERMRASEKDSVIIQLRKAGKIKDSFQPCSDNYLNFIVEELKPYVDNHYSTNKKKEATFISGSSMGGLISIYAICEYPKIFGGAACMSTHWSGTYTLENNPVPSAFLAYLNRKLPNPKNHRIYFDCGDQNLDALYPEIQHQVDRLMQSKGYKASNWQTNYIAGGDHSEYSWNARLHLPLKFLLENKP